jgi:hypothetical protein
MRGECERRLRRLEVADAKSSTFEIWVSQDEYTFCHLHTGECMTREAFYRLYPPGSPGIHIWSRADAML